MITKTVSAFNNGFQWLFQSNQGHSLSVIFHDGSYGRENGLFETMCSWKDDVQGHLTFGEVQEAIDEVYSLDAAAEATIGEQA